jgi:predicted RNase H-like HicB family nuclease
MKKRTAAIPVVILRTKTGFNAFSPAVDGCVATARTVDGALRRMKGALAFHLQGELLVRKQKKSTQATLRDSFDDYGTDAMYASVVVESR